jgi:hypothetical protein
MDFQSIALPTELPHHFGTANIIEIFVFPKKTLKISFFQINDVFTGKIAVFLAFY